jgi:MYXO-CTERM domain-containing protein
MRRPAVFLVIAGVAGAAARPAPARACSIAVPPIHVLDPAMQATDQTPPTLPPTSVPAIARGYAPSGCSGSASTCDDIGIVSLFPNAMDDVTPPERIGFRITLAGGALPSGFTLPADAIEQDPGSALRLTWVDGATDNQDAIDFTLSIIAIDLAGNESTPQTVVVRDSGAPAGGGCRHSSGRAPGPAEIFLGLLGLTLAGRRRRRNQCPRRAELGSPFLD